MRLIASTLTLLAAAVVAPSLAHADDLFTLTPVAGSGNTQTMVFTLPSTPTSIQHTILNPTSEFYVKDANAAIINGGSYTGDDFYFNLAGGPGFGGFYDDLSSLNGYGPQLFSGTVNAPTFLLGTYNLYQTVGGITPDYVLTISATTTPEPSSLVLLGTGVLGLAGAARRRFSK